MELSEQHGITRIAVTGAQLMLAWGADSEMVEDVGQRFGQALGADSVELSISSNSLVLSTRHGDRCVTTTRRIRDHGIKKFVRDIHWLHGGDPKSFQTFNARKPVQQVR